MSSNKEKEARATARSSRWTEDRWDFNAGWESGVDWAEAEIASWLEKTFPSMATNEAMTRIRNGEWRGAVKGESLSCRRCISTGIIIREGFTDDGQFPCPNCRGTGTEEGAGDE